MEKDAEVHHIFNNTDPNKNPISSVLGENLKRFQQTGGIKNLLRTWNGEKRCRKTRRFIASI